MSDEKAGNEFCSSWCVELEKFILISFVAHKECSSVLLVRIFNLRTLIYNSLV